MTTDSRIDRLEISMESLKDEVENLRTDMIARFAELGADVNARFSNMNSDMNAWFSEMNSRFNALLIVNVGFWITTIGTVVGLFLGAN